MKIIIEEQELQEILTKYLKEKNLVAKDIKINIDVGWNQFDATFRNLEIEL